MNAEPSLNMHFNAQFHLQSQKSPVVIGQPMKYASRMARLVSIRKSHSVSERVGWSDVELTIVSGTCEVQFEDESVMLEAEDSLTVPAMIEHAIVAVSDVRLVVSFQLT